ASELVTGRAAVDGGDARASRNTCYLARRRARNEKKATISHAPFLISNNPRRFRPPPHAARIAIRARRGPVPGASRRAAPSARARPGKRAQLIPIYPSTKLRKNRSAGRPSLARRPAGCPSLVFLVHRLELGRVLGLQLRLLDNQPGLLPL